MGDKITLKIDERTVQGKKVARLRSEGLVPSVVYGHKLEPILGQAPYNEVEKVVREAGKSAPVHLTIGGKKRIALIKDIDRDPVKHEVRHVSFHAVKANDVVTAEVPIHLTGEGESAAEKAGLVVLQSLEHIEVKAKPAELPEALEASIVELAEEHDRLTLADITLPEGVEYADHEQDLGVSIANVYEPAALQAANDAAGGDAEEADADDVEAENGTEADGETAASDDSDKKADDDK